ncbi:MAG: class I SAM-dependent methyltransferase [Caldisericales bacterium]|nr:class I SAM-dependent methyltransferase [Caldisericales bacterium]
MTIFNNIGERYDIFVDWDRRLSTEIPFLHKVLRSRNAKKILDVGCATGKHAIELAKLGYDMHGIDISDNLIQKAKRNAQEARTYIDFEAMSMLDITKHKAKLFDAVLMLGNVVSLLDDEKQVLSFFADAKSVLKIGGILVIQTLNYRKMIKNGERYELIETPEPNLIFLKIFDLVGENTRLSIVMLERNNSWEMSEMSQHLMIMTKEDLVRHASRTKFSSISLYGKFDGSPFKGEESDQILAVFEK